MTGVNRTNLGNVLGTQDVSPAAVISLLESAVTKGTQLATFASSANGTALTQPRFSSRELGRDAVAFWGGGIFMKEHKLVAFWGGGKRF